MKIKTTIALLCLALVSTVQAQTGFFSSTWTPIIHDPDPNPANWPNRATLWESDAYTTKGGSGSFTLTVSLYELTADSLHGAQNSTKNQLYDIYLNDNYLGRMKLWNWLGSNSLAYYGDTQTVTFTFENVPAGKMKFQIKPRYGNTDEPSQWQFDQFGLRNIAGRAAYTINMPGDIVNVKDALQAEINSLKTKVSDLETLAGIHTTQIRAINDSINTSLNTTTSENNNQNQILTQHTNALNSINTNTTLVRSDMSKTTATMQAMEADLNKKITKLEHHSDNRALFIGIGAAAVGALSPGVYDRFKTQWEYQQYGTPVTTGGSGNDGDSRYGWFDSNYDPQADIQNKGWIPLTH
jgi:hypothetical protein